jgi:hypothetical protein
MNLYQCDRKVSQTQTAIAKFTHKKILAQSNETILQCYTERTVRLKNENHDQRN